MKKNLISAVLVIALLVGMTPLSVFADEMEDDAVISSTEEAVVDNAEEVIDEIAAETVNETVDEMADEAIDEIINELINDADTSLTQAGAYGSFIDGAHVIDDMIGRINRKEINAHPRIVMTKDKFDNLRMHVGEKSVTGTLINAIRKEADNEYDKKVETYVLSSGYSLVEVSKRIQRRVAVLAMAYNIFGDEKYAQRAYKELENACDNFKDWNPQHFLDPAEMCTAFAFGYDWLYDWLDESQKEKLRENMIEKGLKQVMRDYNNSGDYRTYNWLTSVKGDNWQFVCTGGTNLAALAIGDEADSKEIASQVLTYGFRRAYTCFRQGYRNTDGTYVEGLGYCDYATYYLGLQVSALICATGTDYGLVENDRLNKTADFIRYMSSNNHTSFSFGDDRPNENTAWASSLWLAEYLNKPEVAVARLEVIKETGSDSHGFNYLDVLWIDESKQNGMSANDYPIDWGFVGSHNASFRTSWDKSGMITALHTGENDYTFHGHYDLGSFYIEANGARFFTDLGNEDYNLDGRELSYRIQAEGHNTLVLNPGKGLQQKDKVTCTVTQFGGGNEAYAVTDLTAAYADSNAKSVIRGLKMIKDKECVIVQDEISLNSAGELYWFAHTGGEINIAADGRSAIITVSVKKKVDNKEVEEKNYLWVGLLSQGGTFTAMDAKALNSSTKVPGANANEGYHKLSIHFTNIKDTTISVACISLKAGETRPSWIPSVVSISEWKSTGTGPETDISTPKYNVIKQNLTLSDHIAMNLITEISDDIASTAGANMTFTLNGRKIVVPMSDAEKINSNGEMLYKFSCPVPATEMGDVMEAVFTAGDYTSEKYWCSVKDYAEYMLRNPEDFEGYIPLVKAMLNYGTAAQNYFGYNTEYPVNSLLTTQDRVMTTIKADMFSKYKCTITGSSTSYTYIGMSLVLKDKVELKLTFRTGSKIVYETIPLNIGELGTGKKYTFHGYTFTNLSAYSYIQLALSENVNTLTDISRALYDYNEAARAVR
ncbi:MAG: heparinase II/III family protein [Lachnospiraceae bacterium]|nr:heparinase II/III family protein [Lachnospiraceae bacterium]